MTTTTAHLVKDDWVEITIHARVLNATYNDHGDLVYVRVQTSPNGVPRNFIPATCSYFRTEKIGSSS